MPEIAQLLGAMITYYNGDARRIQHFIKVHDLARTIGLLEGLDKDTLLTLEAAAAVHGIGIHLCELKYGACDGRMQEIEGPPLAGDMLRALGFADKPTAEQSYEKMKSGIIRFWLKRICWPGSVRKTPPKSASGRCTAPCSAPKRASCSAGRCSDFDVRADDPPAQGAGRSFVS